MKAATSTSRRNFLRAAGVSSAAGVAAVATLASGIGQNEAIDAQALSKAKVDDDRAGSGYHETAHIRNYYRTTQV